MEQGAFSILHCFLNYLHMNFRTSNGRGLHGWHPPMDMPHYWVACCASAALKQMNKDPIHKGTAPTNCKIFGSIRNKPTHWMMLLSTASVTAHVMQILHRFSHKHVLFRYCIKPAQPEELKARTLLAAQSRYAFVCETNW
jgi:hypothetical protein